jgi:hypothetical protein
MNNNAYLLINPLKESSLDLANKIKELTSGKVVMAPNIAVAQLYLQQELFDAIFLTLTTRSRYSIFDLSVAVQYSDCGS